MSAIAATAEPYQSIRGKWVTAGLETVALLLFLAIPIMDVAVGAIALITGLSTGYDTEEKLVTLLPGMALRAILVAVLVLLLWRTRQAAVLLCIGLVGVFALTSESVSLLLHQAAGSFIYGASYAFKLILTLIVALYIATAERANPVLQNGSRILRNGFAVYTLAVTGGYISGFQYITYGGLGSSGLMIMGSANSVSLAILLGVPFVLEAVSRSKSWLARLWWTAVYLNGFFAAWLLLTKGAMLGMILPTLAYIVLRIVSRRSPIPYIAALLVMMTAAVIMASIDWSQFVLVRRTADVLDHHGGDIVAALFSGRLTFIRHGWQAFLAEFRPHEWLIGAGAAGARNAVGTFSGVEQGVESDFLDLALVYGLVGFAVSVGLWLLVLRRACAVLLRPAGTMAHMLAFNIFLQTILAVVAGHVITSGLGGFILGLTVGLLFRQPVLEPLAFVRADDANRTSGSSFISGSMRRHRDGS